MSVVVARSVSDEAIRKGQCPNGGERLLRFARNDMPIRELAIVPDQVNILVVNPRIRGKPDTLTFDPLRNRIHIRDSMGL